MASHPTAGVPQAAVGYFVDQKKGEVNELKQLLKNINVERDVKKKRETIKKVIAYMTLGIDVSRLFTDMIMAIETKDIVIKKMVYLYLCNYANKEPEMAIMCINSLRRDCDNEDPMVRGLALRSLCNLRLDSVLEYIETPLQKSLQDVSAYVRKTAVMGVLKVNSLSPDLVESNGYISQLYRMLEDHDATVITNCIFVINELLLPVGGLAVTQTLLMNLLNRVGEFSEWGLNAILELVSRYIPSSDDEVYAMMNLLDPVLRTANSSAVLSTVKCFINLTAGLENRAEMHTKIYMRAKPPMLTFITGSHSESQYTILRHLDVLLHQKDAAGVFDDEYRQFFVRYNEAPHVKHLKVDLLPLITSELNARDIATELGEYVTDVDAELAKRAIRSIGKIAMKILQVSVEMAQTLMELINMDSPYVRSEAATVLVNITRINPAISGIVLPYIPVCIRKIEDPDSKASMIWLLGEYGDKILEAPYILETLIDGYSEEPAVTVKLQILIAAMKMFFQRPPEVQAMLGRLLKYAVMSDTASSQDLHDRTLLYYRLLLTDLKNAEALFKTKIGDLAGDGTRSFSESKDEEKISQLFAEFNSLSILYGLPAVRFISSEYQLKLEKQPVSDFDIAPMQPPPQPVAHADAPTSAVEDNNTGPVARGSISLLDWGDDDVASATSVASSTGGSSGGDVMPPLQQQHAPVIAAQLTLDDSSALSPPQFQSMWTNLPEAFNGAVCNLASVPSAVADMEAALRVHKVITIASGPFNMGFKLFLFGRETRKGGGEEDLLSMQMDADTGSSHHYLAQLAVSSGEVSATIKTDAPGGSVNAQRFADVIGSCLQSKYGGV